MKILGPTPLKRLNEVVALVFLFAAVYLTLALVSYSPADPSWNTATGVAKPHNIVGRFGATLADLLLQTGGLTAFLAPVFLLCLAWKWVRSSEIDPPWAKVAGATLLGFGAASALGMGPDWRLFRDAIPLGGLAGSVFADLLVSSFNLTGAVLFASFCMLLSLYLLTTFSVYSVPVWFRHPGSIFGTVGARFAEWKDSWRQRRAAKAAERAARKQAAQEPPAAPEIETPAFLRQRSEVATAAVDGEIPIHTVDDMISPPVVEEPARVSEPAAAAPPPAPEPEEPVFAEPAVVEYVPPAPVSRPPWEAAPEPKPIEVAHAPKKMRASDYSLPSTALLNEPDPRMAYDAQELKDIAVRIKSKFEEFNVLGSVTQINPGPVVTTFEFKPEAGIKYSRITTLTEDLCLGLQAESILIERIPGKPTVGIEVPNTKRELISLRQILESDEFQASPSRMTLALGKDISGRIKVASLETMPHLLIAGSTGSGKSVMLNSLIMSILYKSTPAEVKMMLVDPKRVEMGPYENIPHLLTPVITDARKATNALRNAVLEMDRRLKLLAGQGVRNIDQFNRKVKQLKDKPRSLFDDDLNAEQDELEPLPYILIVIDELADLMMIERANVEESVTRLAQMARAVGMHLVLATQRPSVDVITGLIKANFPARISFRVATRVDSRTILDVMGAEHLLGKGDMLFLPPGSSRLVRVHAAYVTETEIAQVTDFWKQQAQPDYDQSYLMAPPDEEDPDAEKDDFSDFNDPMYEDAIRVILEVGKASTSVLQRRLRLGYGRAARILDKMHHDGIIGPPDGSRPREILRRPEWIDQVEAR
ncbi:MAG: DNA translocase FtsK [Bryobacteraceae bacterium]